MNNTPNTQYRQGDVMIERIAALPDSLRKTHAELGKTILAHGEVTGHHHAFTLEHAEKFTTLTGEEYFNIKGEPMTLTLPVIREWKNQIMVNHPQHGIIEFARSDITVENGNAIIIGDFAVLKHDEHTAHGIPAGYYKGSGMGGTVHQREYTAKAIQRVAD